MSNENVSQQEPAWPRPSQHLVLPIFEQRCQDLSGSAKRRAGRPATVRWSQLCLAIMLCFLRGWNAQVEVWRLMCSERIGSVAPGHVSDHARSNRIERAVRPLQGLFEHVSAWLRRRLAPWATAVYTADASTLDQMSRFLPWVRRLSEGDPRLLAGQISALCDVRLQHRVRVDSWSNARDHGKTYVLTLGERVQAGALLLFDRGSFRVAFCDTRTLRGIWWMSRYAHQARSPVSHICSHADGLLDAMVYMGTSHGHQARYPVRLIPFWLHGRHSRSLTTALDPHVGKRSDVVGLSARRWDIERAFRALKNHLRLHPLWSAKEAVVHVQRWCRLILAHVSHALPVEMAGQAGVGVGEVSLDVLVCLAAGWLSRGLTPLESAGRFGRDLDLIRPSTRSHIEVPWIDPCWIVPPPPEAVHPRKRVRSRSQTKGTGRKRTVGRVRLINGTLHVLE
jgi:hypothetical protein